MLLWIVWLFLAALFVWVELQSGTFYFLLLGVSACISMGLALAGSSLLVQCFAFVGSALFFYIFLIPILRKIIPKPKEEAVTRAQDALVGQQAVVVEPIEPEDGGLVRIRGELWSAVADEFIGQGETVRVVEVRVSKLHVKKE